MQCIRPGNKHKNLQQQKSSLERSNMGGNLSYSIVCWKVPRLPRSLSHACQLGLLTYPLSGPATLPGLLNCPAARCRMTLSLKVMDDLTYWSVLTEMATAINIEALD